MPAIAGDGIGAPPRSSASCVGGNSVNRFMQPSAYGEGGGRDAGEIRAERFRRREAPRTKRSLDFPEAGSCPSPSPCSNSYSFLKHASITGSREGIANPSASTAWRSAERDQSMKGSS